MVVVLYINNGKEDDNDEDMPSSAMGNGNPRIIHLPNSNALLAWTGLYGDGLGFAEEMNVLLGINMVERYEGLDVWDFNSRSMKRRGGGGK